MIDKVNKKVKKKKVPRTEMPQQDPRQRIKNFNEVALGYSMEDALKEADRCLQCRKPKCIDGCPVEIDIKSFIDLIDQKKFDQAIDKIREKNSLPAICGRVCPQEDQCEKECILGIKDEPVAIGRLERFLGDMAIKKELADTGMLVEKEEAEKNSEHKTAVIGSGPAGLACASELAKMGYQVTIFEALHKAGGVLVYGIPEFRLPKKVLQKEIDSLKTMGVEIKLDMVIGKVLSVQELFDMGYESVFIATGAGLPYFMDIEGENLNGVYSANEYLTRSNLMKAYEFPGSDTPIKKAPKVAVVGGGNVAMDSARTAKRLGAEHVYLVYRRSEQEMPARKEEAEHAKEEGIEFVLLTNPVKIKGKDGWVDKLRVIKMDLGEPDQSGRRRPIPIEGSEYDLDVDVVVMAIGQGPNPLLLADTPKLKLNKWGNIEADLETGKTNMKGVFAGGDIVTGAATVILAMGAGKKAAHAIDNYIKSGKW
ncbi:MAG: NADPH-dependent glutamate synthase [Actinomycetia bacterium]|nr:NADPH-dependent glutamate synthase [Actinomycetes bacterium]